MSDIIGQLCDGRFFSIETKRPKEEPTEAQYEFMWLVNKYRGVSGWADSVEKALTIVEREK